MNLPPDSEPARLRWGVYWLLIAISAGATSGRILAVNAVDRTPAFEKLIVDRELMGRRRALEAQGLSPAEVQERLAAEKPAMVERARQQRPFLSANDRSRWATVRSIVEYGTYAIDDVVSQPTWDTIDMVRHKDADGEYHFYSSKPPLMATLMAGEYWLIHKLTGATLGSHPYEIGRFMLLTLNVIPLILLFWLVARFAERFGRSDWGRIFVVAAACFGTFLTTFAIVINNHLHAAVSAAIALHCAWRIWYDGERRWKYFFFAGCFAAFTAANEMPALSFFALLTLGLAWKAPRETLSGYAVGAALVVAAYFGTNYLAHGTFNPPYGHRSDDNPDDNWYRYTYTRTSDGKQVDSHWMKPTGIDAGEESRTAYVVHVLVGHHGIFSLTPIWLLSLPGLVLLGRGWDGWARLRARLRPAESAAGAGQGSAPAPQASGQHKAEGYGLGELAIFIAVLSLVCLTFYLLRPLEDRNYGGMTAGFRWMFWFAPMWLMALLPAADRLARSRRLQALGAVLLALSALSASYPTWNPWTHPWLMNYMLHEGWVELP